MFHPYIPPAWLGWLFTASGKAIALGRHERMRRFLDEMDQEVRGAT